MNPVHLHLIINHIPIIGMGFTLLLFIIGYVRKSDEVIKISLIFVIFLALITIVVHQNGESAEEYVKGKEGYSDEVVQTHDVAADLAFISTEILGVLAVITIIARRYYKKISKVLLLITILALIVSGGLMIRAANLGGKISHPEVESIF